MERNRSESQGRPLMKMQGNNEPTAQDKAAPDVMSEYRAGGLYPDGSRDTALRDILRAVPESWRIYLALTFWSLLAWPMTFAHVFDNLGLSPNAGNLMGLTVGFYFEGMILVTGETPAEKWAGEARYRRFALLLFSVNICVVFVRAILMAFLRFLHH
mgnify:CR=1 FL=1